MIVPYLFAPDPPPGTTQQALIEQSHQRASEVHKQLPAYLAFVLVTWALFALVLTIHSLLRRRRARRNT